MFNQLDLANCLLMPSRIDIWLYSLATLHEDAATLLDATELARANRYHFARHSRRFIMARAILRCIIGRYLNIPPKDIAFTYQTHGKPEIPHPAQIQFNLSHSQDMALLAIGQNYPMGIDIEFFTDRPYDGIGTHAFSPEENMQLHKATNELKALTFFNIWAQKEAVIKACGLGLHYPLTQISMPPLPQGHTQIFDPKHQQDWQLLSFSPLVNCCAALCYNLNVQTLRYIHLDNPWERLI